MSDAFLHVKPGFASAFPDSLSADRQLRKAAGSIPRQMLHCLGIAALAVASYFIVSHFVVQSVEVVGRSMVPTLSDSQSYVLNHWVYFFHAPRRCDIVVLRDPTDDGFSVKRAIAAPGDSVGMKDGRVYLNGRPLNETYLAPGTLTFTDAACGRKPIRCGKDQFFVLGDNRANSVDSRLYGPVRRGDILGRIIW